MTVYRIRRDLALLLTLPIVVLTATASLALAATEQPILVALAVVYVVVAAVLAARMYQRIRRRTLAVSETGLTAQRDSYRIEVPWADVVGVERRRRLGLTADELVLSDPDLSFVDAEGKPTRADRRVTDHPALRRIQVSLYDKAWRDGPIGQRLTHLKAPS